VKHSEVVGFAAVPWEPDSVAAAAATGSGVTAQLFSGRMEDVNGVNCQTQAPASVPPSRSN
jgi:hypothetical protein